MDTKSREEGDELSDLSNIETVVLENTLQLSLESFPNVDSISYVSSPNSTPIIVEEKSIVETSQQSYSKFKSGKLMVI